MRREERFRGLLDKMSPELQGLVTTHCYSHYITCVPFFTVKLDGYTGYKRVRVEEEVKMFVTAVRRNDPFGLGNRLDGLAGWLAG